MVFDDICKSIELMEQFDNINSLKIITENKKKIGIKNMIKLLTI